MSDIFGDIKVATIVSGRSLLGQQIEEAWQLWVSLTERPDRDTIPEKFRAEYRRMIDKNFKHEDNLEIINAAARLDPRPSDPLDIRRVLMPLTNYDHERAARALLKADSPIITFPKPDTKTTKSNIEDLEDACETDRGSWTENDLQAAGILIAELTPKEMRYTADRVALHIDSERILPTDMLRHYKAVGKGKITAKARADRNSYNAGRSESDTIKNVQFLADIASEKMLVRGTEPQEIILFHNQAPDGYWDSVIEQMNNNTDLTHKQIYDELESEFQWHPSQRKRK